MSKTFTCRECGFDVAVGHDCPGRWEETPARLRALASSLAGALREVLDFAQPETHRGPDTPRWVEAMSLADKALAEYEAAFASFPSQGPEQKHTYKILCVHCGDFHDVDYKCMREP